MKELGEYLKEKREETGVGVEEAADDLNLTKDDIENIEEGNIRAFKDVLKLKEIVKEYAKYLGLDPEKVVDEFNDFLFEHTSKISLDDILEAKKKHEEEEKKVVSPYTHSAKKHINIDNLVALKPIFITILMLLFLILVGFILIKVTGDKDSGKPVRTTELMVEGRAINEFA